MRVLRKSEVRLTISEFLNLYIVGERKLFINRKELYSKANASLYNKFSRHKKTLREKHSDKEVIIPQTWLVRGAGESVLFVGFIQDYRLITSAIYNVIHKRDAVLDPIREQFRKAKEQTAFEFDHFTSFDMKLPDDSISEL